MIFRSSILILAPFLFSVSMAQVGMDELQKKVPDSYAGNPSVIVKTSSRIDKIIKSWGLTRFLGENASDYMDRGIINHCSVVVTKKAKNTIVTVTEYTKKSADQNGPLVVSVDFKNKDRVLESLSSGLESIAATYDVVNREKKTGFVPETKEPPLAISAAEGSIYVDVNDGNQKASCSYTEEYD
jgi:hypothetical protein